MAEQRGYGYDGVIVGSGALAREAALRLTADQSRRVAVVAARSPGSLVGSSALGLMRASAAQGGAAWGARWGWGTGLKDGEMPPLEGVQGRSQLLHEREFSTDDWAIAAAAGADVVLCEGETSARFERDRRGWPVLRAGDRQFKSRHYLLVEDAPWAEPTVPRFEDLPWMTPDDPTQRLLMAPIARDRPNRWLVVGGTPEAVTLALALARLGSAVTLAVAGSALIPTLADELERPARSLLTAAGVTIALGSPVIHGQRIQGQPWVQVGAIALAVDAVLWATGRQPRDRWNLAALGVTVSPEGIAADRHLRTAHPALRVAGSLLGGWGNDTVTQAELTTAIAPLLGQPIPPMDYGLVPQVIATDPPLAQVGHTVATARRVWSDRVRIYRQDLSRTLQSADRDRGMGWRLLICGPGDRLLGACAFGSDAPAWVDAIAIALGQGLRLQDLGPFPWMQAGAPPRSPGQRAGVS
ncbi:MAG: hypothetical protein Fur0042_26730 [Cyanophyceae cyanobacterium]